MEGVPKSNYNASTKTKVAVVAGTLATTGLCVANMMKKGNIKHLHNLEIGIKEGIDLCCASTIGGLATGLLIDKPENRKYKLKDGVNQLIGNTLIPYACLALSNKLTKNLSKVTQTIMAIGAMFGTTFLGHNIANKVNEKIFKEDSGYNCTLKDIIWDVDDLIFCASTVFKNKKLYQTTAALSPFTFITHGYLAGTRQQDKRLDKYV